MQIQNSNTCSLTVSFYYLEIKNLILQNNEFKQICFKDVMVYIIQHNSDNCNIYRSTFLFNKIVVLILLLIK